MNDFQPKKKPLDGRPQFARPQSRPAMQPVSSEQPTSELPSLESIDIATPTESLSVAPSKSKRNWKKWLIVSLVTLISLTMIGVLGAYFWYQQGLKAVEPGSDEMVKIVVEPGTGPEGIASLLKENQLIRSEAAFGWYVRMQGKSGLLQAGSYRLGKGEDVSTIVKHLTSGNTDTFSITFLPGATLAEHRKVLIDAGYSKDVVDAALSKTYDTPLFAGKPATADLEGYIYGETYNFNADATPEDILKYVFEYFNTIVEDENLVSLYKKQGFSLYEGITLASIIQREVATAQDAAQVSQVFQLRLKRGMELGSDVTYQYIADKTGQQRSVDLDSPYNTRRYGGLPPGPISSPGIDSLKAVGTPAQGDYLYFLSGDDDKTYFGRTNEEHEKNIQEHCHKKCQII